MLATHKQQMGESIDTFFRKLKQSSIDCNLTSVTAENHRSEAVRDAFITGLTSHAIRQRLLESSKLDLQTAYNQARALESVQKNCELYKTNDAFFSQNAATSSDNIAGQNQKFSVVRQEH